MAVNWIPSLGKTNPFEVLSYLLSITERYNASVAALANKLKSQQLVSDKADRRLPLVKAENASSEYSVSAQLVLSEYLANAIHQSKQVHKVVGSIADVEGLY